MAKVVLITGATGKQGGSVLNALLNNEEFTLLAVTRDASNEGAKKLIAKGSNVKIVEGTLDDAPALFRNAAKVAGGPLWGVYSVQVSQGKGVTHEGEIKQGKAMVDEAVKAGVKHFVYGSVERGGDEASWDNPTPIPHFQSKFVIEHHLKNHAGTMGWTILRPVAFCDNLEPTFPSQVFVAALRDTLGPKKPNQWVAVRDIGIFAKLAFEKPDEYNRRALGLAGDELTSSELDRAFRKTTTQGMAGTFWILGAILKRVIGELGLMIDWFGAEGYKADISALKKLHPGLMNMETWILRESSFPKR